MSNKTTIKFGTSGYRGIIAETFTTEEVVSICKALSIYLKNKSTQPVIALAYDPRKGNCPFLKESSFTKTITTTLTNCGVSVHFFTDFAPTPFLAWYVPKFNLDGGIILTASHNPPEYNGIKFNPSSGAPSPESVTTEIEKNLNINFQNNQLPQGNLKLITPDFDLFAKDIKDRLIQLGLNFEKIESKMNVCIDTKHGSAHKTWQAITKIFGYSQVHYLHHEPLQNFNYIETNPCNTNELNPLKSKILQKKAALGIANDPDADRHIILDELGHCLSPEETALIILDFFTAQNIKFKAIISTLASSMRLSEASKKGNFSYHETNVGFKYIAQHLETYKHKNQLAMGIESSGGFSTSFHTLEKCGFLPGILIMLAVNFFKKPLSELKRKINETYGSYYFKENAITFKKEHNQIIKDLFFNITNETLQAHFSNRIINTSNKDGLKIIFNNHQWALLRFSGTEPVIRIYVESNCETTSSKLEKETLEFIDRTINTL